MVRTRVLFIKFCVAWPKQPPPPPILLGFRIHLFKCTIILCNSASLKKNLVFLFQYVLVYIPTSFFSIWPSLWPLYVTSESSFPLLHYQKVIDVYFFAQICLCKIKYKSPLNVLHRYLKLRTDKSIHFVQKVQVTKFNKYKIWNPKVWLFIVCN